MAKLLAPDYRLSEFEYEENGTGIILPPAPFSDLVWVSADEKSSFR